MVGPWCLIGGVVEVEVRGWGCGLRCRRRGNATRYEKTSDSCRAAVTLA
ncbi:hypothetical protein [Streptomyces lydicus]|nr:hypothetical protein [Streptomyces lydicus]